MCSLTITIDDGSGEHSPERVHQRSGKNGTTHLAYSDNENAQGLFRMVFYGLMIHPQCSTYNFLIHAAHLRGDVVVLEPLDVVA